MDCSICCIFNNSPTIDLSDPCVCNAAIGATLVTSTGAIYIRTVQSAVCSINDWELVASSSVFSMDDEFGGQQTVGNAETVHFVGQNGATVTVQAGDIVVIDGRTYYGVVPPTLPPNDTATVGIYVNCASAELYAWCPTSGSWIGPMGGSGGGSFIITDGTSSQQINGGDTVTFTSSDNSVTLVVSATDTISLTVTPNNLPITDAGNYYVAGNVEAVLQEIGALKHPAASLTNLASPFAWNSATQAGNIPQTPSLVNNGNGTLTFTRGNGSSQAITIPYTDVQVLGGTEIRFTFPDGSFLPVDICEIVEVCRPIVIYPNFVALNRTPAINEDVQFIDTSTSNAPIDIWLWEYSTDGISWSTFSTQQNPVYAFTAAGSYWIRETTTSNFSINTPVPYSVVKQDYIVITVATAVANFTSTVPTIFTSYEDCNNLPEFL